MIYCILKYTKVRTIAKPKRLVPVTTVAAVVVSTSRGQITAIGGLVYSRTLLLGLGFVSLSWKEQFLFLLKLPDPYHCFPPVLLPKDCCLCCCCNNGAAATIAAAAAPCESNMAATIASESSFFFLQHDVRRSCESLKKNFTTEKIFFCCSFA
jgi:hypothetical protein